MSNKTVQKVTVKQRSQMHVNKNRTVPEVFDVVAEKDSVDEKVMLLKAYDTKALRYIIHYMYNVDWSGMNVPRVKLNHRPPEICSQNLNKVVTDIETAYKYRETKPDVTDRVLSRILVELSSREAQLLMDIFKGKKVKGISKSVFEKAYPQFFRTEQETKAMED